MDSALWEQFQATSPEWPFNLFYLAAISIEEFAKINSALVLYALIPRAFYKR